MQYLKKVFWEARFLLLSILIFKLVLLAVAPLLVLIQSGGETTIGLDLFYRWDAGNYLKISDFGYSPLEKGHHYLLVFFPLWPLLMSIVGAIVGTKIAGIVLAQVFSLAAAALLYALVKMDYGKKMALVTTGLAFVFPSAFYYLVPYTESLFLFLVVGFFLAIRKEQFFWAGVLGMLAAMTRITGILLIIPFLLEYYEVNRFKIKASLYDLLLIPVGLGAYLLTNHAYSGDMFEFLAIQADLFTKKTFSILAIPSRIYHSVLNFFVGDKSSTNAIIIDVFESFFTIVALILVLYGWKKLRRSYFWFAMASLVIILGQNFWLSNSRYIITVFPIFIMMGLIFCEKEGFKLRSSLGVAWGSVSFILFGFFYYRFLMGYVTLL